jgi:hypothetical protein
LAKEREARSAKQVLGDGEGVSTALGRKRKGRGRRMLSFEVKIHLALPLGFIDPWSHAPRIARAACINCRRTAQSLTGGTHHDRGGRVHAHARSLRRGNRRAVAGRHVRPRRPLRARPRRLKSRTRSAELWTRLRALNGPVPYQVRTTLEWPEHEARKTRPSKGVIMTSGLEAPSA